MATKNRGFFLIFIGLIIVGLFFFSDFGGLQSIIPELDNRITYYDTPIDSTQLARTNPSISEFWENDKFTITTNRDPVMADSTCITGTPTTGDKLTVKKDFSRLNVFIKWYSQGNGRLSIGGSDFETGTTIFQNYEIKPDNLNIGIYDIFENGEFIRRIDTGNELLTFEARSNYNDPFCFDYIKYVPIETFTIKNDEVWVKEVRASDYSVSDLNWEMIGYHTQIRPATIRDLTDEIEVPAPQIYINLINGLPVEVAPNTIHTFFYKTKWTTGLDSSCQGDLDKVEIKVGDVWVCESYVTETPIIQQCKTKDDCAILPECDAQKDLISCNQETNLCDYTLFSPECKNQLIVYQEKVTEIENTIFIPITLGTNSFFCFFDKTQTSCQIGEKTLSISSPSYVCSLPSGSSTSISTGQNNDNCWKSTLSFDGTSFTFENNEEKANIGFNIKGMASMGATIIDGTVKDSWSTVVKGTFPDNFMEIKAKDLGNKFILQNSDDKITFTIINNLGFGIDGGYTIQTQNLALEGGVVLLDETKNLFLQNGDNDITYNFETKQLGTILDIIGTFGKITTDKEYIINPSDSFFTITKEIVTELPKDIEKVNAVIIEENAVIIEENQLPEIIQPTDIVVAQPTDINLTAQPTDIVDTKSKLPILLLVIAGIIGVFMILKYLKYI